MSNKLQPVRGTHDILPDEFEKFAAVVNTARDLATLYGFREMATPIFEGTEVFSRSMGETSDVVSKEMFTFDTRGGESVTLRPEFTAGIARAFISNGMQQNLPLKLFSTGPLFRYERPQKGRQRQFHQVNFEWLGDNSWMADVEVITLAGHLLYSFSGSKGCTLHINTLGDTQSREKYREALVAYLTPFADKLSEDSKRRLSENPLRILDSKDNGDKEILLNAPVMSDYLSDEAKKRFQNIGDVLKKNRKLFSDIIIDPTLVRGLDYYTDIVFEFIANMGELGAQSTVLAGGRYDGLIEQMGGKPTAAIGFAAGVERLILLGNQEKIEKKNAHIDIVVLPPEGRMSYWHNGEMVDEVFELTVQMRNSLHSIFAQKGLEKYLCVQIDWLGTLKKRLEKANKKCATHVIIMPVDEIEKEIVVIKNMQTRKEDKVSFADLRNLEKLKEIFGIV